MTLPYDEIYETRNRSWSLVLFERLISPDTAAEERGKITSVFLMLEDPRYAQPLRDVLTNTKYPDEIREAAGDVLGGIGISIDRETLRAWWNGDDPLLRRSALYSMGPENADIIEQVASDPSHLFYGDAINRMSFSFELPRHTRLKIKALTHQNPEVRERAAFCLLWDEPAAAETALILATYDPVPAVAEAACNTLEYYPTQRVFRRAAELRNHTDEKVRETAEKTYGAIRGVFQSALTDQDKQIRKHIRHWLEPMWDELAFTRKQLKRERFTGHWHKKKGRKVSVKQTARLLNDPNTSPLVINELFYPGDWRSIPAKKRNLLTLLCLGHPDPLVRAESTHAFRAWKDQKSLLHLLDDPEFYPRKAAMYALGETPPYRNKIAEIIWDYLQTHPDAVGTHGSEAMSAYIAHAKHKKALPRLIALIQNPEIPEGLRLHAAIALSPWEDRTELLGLMPLLEKEPALTWALHIELLNEAAIMGFVPPSLERLREIDHLHLQVALVPFS
jgi:HEAT repeat protein